MSEKQPINNGSSYYYESYNVVGNNSPNSTIKGINKKRFDGTSSIGSSGGSPFQNKLTTSGGAQKNEYFVQQEIVPIQVGNTGTMNNSSSSLDLSIDNNNIFSSSSSSNSLKNSIRNSDNNNLKSSTTSTSNLNNSIDNNSNLIKSNSINIRKSYNDLQRRSFNGSTHSLNNFNSNNNFIVKSQSGSNISYSLNNSHGTTTPPPPPPSSNLIKSNSGSNLNNLSQSLKTPNEFLKIPRLSQSQSTINSDNLEEVPLSPFDQHKNPTTPTTTTTTSTTIITNNTVTENNNNTINNSNELIKRRNTMATTHNTHNELRKNILRKTVDSPIFSQSSSYPYIPPPQVQFENIITKKEAKKDKKIEKEIMEAMHERDTNEINPNPLAESLSMKKNKKKKKLKREKRHPSWLLMRTIQTGILNCISQTSNQSINEDSDMLFQSFHYILPVIEDHPKMTFSFKDYCPHAFSRLRDIFNIDSTSYLHSICKTWNEVSTPGKSGSIFFFSSDSQYVLKTIPKREANLLVSLLPEYYEHMKRNPNSLLTKFFGLHRVKPKEGRQVRFVVMKNLFYTPKQITQRFDLKGSTVGRELTPEELKKKNPTFKDLDFRRLGMKIFLGPDRKKLFMHQISEDCKFLVKLNIMDYSLLVGLHRKQDIDHYNNVNSGISSGSTGDPHEDNEFYDDYYDGDEEESSSDSSTSGGEGDRTSGKKISSVQETKNYWDHYESTHINSTDYKEDQRQKQLKTIEKEKYNEDYLKPIHLPILPPVLPDSYTYEPPNYIAPKVSIFEHDKGGMQGIDEENNPMGEYYFMGIIDILMLYSFRKRVEHKYKSLFNKGEVSSVDPVEYAARFINFISDTIV
ncbi:hypothetical protein CYY_007868 [Polysphondylium violaceum]|uniref:PIPK domain-containing protein n=1 Tax=Polysphondylium violaceum TaxID=133409 RepID=A0A8J4PQ54_9MYCE|nr:hypothetical protein CYY_007868 [Polysphondylium violaceum]